MPNHTRTYAQALAEATSQAMELDPSVIVMGQGIRDKGAIFGSAEGLFEKFGPQRVIEMPIAESAVAGICVGAALKGMRPLLILQRADFGFLIMDQIINHASKYHFMFAGQTPVPITIRLIVGKGWGQGPQHSQSLHSTFAHFPGLRVMAPTDAYTAKGILLNSIFSNDPVVIFEGRPLFSSSMEIPSDPYVVPFKAARKVREGKDVTIVAVSYMVPEAEQACHQLEKAGISVDLIDLVSVNPLDMDTICASVCETKRLMVVDSSWAFCGISAEISAQVYEQIGSVLSAPVKRLALPFCPAPTGAAMEKQFYPQAQSIVEATTGLLKQEKAIQV